MIEDKEIGNRFTLLAGDCLERLREMASESVNCCVTSPPYWGLRDYGVAGQLGLEKTPEEYVSKMVAVFREVRRVLRDDGTLWLNLGDSYAQGGSGGSSSSSSSSLQGYTGPHCKQAKQQAQSFARKAPVGLKPKDLVGIPWMVAFALRADGWYLRQEIIWHKPNPMPESVRDRCTKAHEQIFLLAKSERYYFDGIAMKEPSVSEGARGGGKKYSDKAGDIAAAFSTAHNLDQYRHTGMRNKRSVWSVATRAFKGAHFATFPPDLIEPCVLAGCPKDGTVLDPFNGAGTTGVVALKHGRKYVGIELNPEYLAMAQTRIEAAQPVPTLFGGAQ
jgi:DNA modification methylase